jgi:hypothetical protein
MEMEIKINVEEITAASVATIETAIKAAIADQYGIQSAIKQEVKAAFDEAGIAQKVGAEVKRILGPNIEDYVKTAVEHMTPVLLAGCKQAATGVIVDALLAIRIGGHYVSDEEKRGIREEIKNELNKGE